MVTRSKEGMGRERVRKASGSAEWKRIERERMREAGFVLVQVWAHEDDRAEVVRYAARKREQREAKRG